MKHHFSEFQPDWNHSDDGVLLVLTRKVTQADPNTLWLNVVTVWATDTASSEYSLKKEDKSWVFFCCLFLKISVNALVFKGKCNQDHVNKCRPLMWENEEFENRLSSYYPTSSKCSSTWYLCSIYFKTFLKCQLLEVWIKTSHLNIKDFK